VRTEVGDFSIECSRRMGETVHLLARPQVDGSESNMIRGIVKDVVFRHDRFIVTFDNDMYIYLDQAPNIGDRVSANVKVECLA
ncbi:MAG TPA: hypothetical protein VJ821_07610, partial [Anaerolineales bacterium]|nr:hypothetical protein [Anaerolineales bacterium]